jgi:hypothetical protein
MDEKLIGSGCIGIPLWLPNETATVDMQLLEILMSMDWINFFSWVYDIAASSLTFLPGHFLAGLLLIAS